VGVDGIPPYFIQWYSNNVAIPGSTNQSYRFQPLRYADGTQYKAIVQNDFSSFISSTGTLTVIVDSTSPTLVSAVGGVNRANASVIFSEAMAVTGATNPANYTITNAAGATLAVSSVILSPNGKVATLTTAPQTANAQYWVVVNNVTDRAGIPNPIAANSVASFVATELDLLAGKVLFRAYNAGGNSTAVDAMVTIHCIRISRISPNSSMVSTAAWRAIQRMLGSTLAIPAKTMARPWSDISFRRFPVTGFSIRAPTMVPGCS